MKTKDAKSVDEYLSVLPSPVKKTLADLRKAIKAAAPSAEEKISYRIPTYTQNGALVHFAAFPRHCSFIVVNKDLLRQFEDQLSEFKTSGTTIQFTPDKPIPASVIKRIVQLRVKENSEHRIREKKKNPSSGDVGTAADS